MLSGPLRLVLYQKWLPVYTERLECGHIWRPTWRNATGSYRMGIIFAARRRCAECAPPPAGAGAESNDG